MVETLGFTSTETIKAYQGRGSWGVANFISNTYSLHCHRQNDSALRWAVVWAILMFHWLCGQSHKTVSINHNFWREEKGEPKRIEPRSFRFLAKRLTARPHRLTLCRSSVVSFKTVAADRVAWRHKVTRQLDAQCGQLQAFHLFSPNCFAQQNLRCTSAKKGLGEVLGKSDYIRAENELQSISYSYSAHKSVNINHNFHVREYETQT